jgi:hypothetical protein
MHAMHQHNAGTVGIHGHRAGASQPLLSMNITLHMFSDMPVQEQQGAHTGLQTPRQVVMTDTAAVRMLCIACMRTW